MRDRSQEPPILLWEPPVKAPLEALVELDRRARRSLARLPPDLVATLPF
jgi:hypothetical protein